MGALLLFVPVGIFLSLAFLPKGRQALAGIAIAFVAAQLLWRINVPEGGGGPLGTLFTLAQIAMVLAAVAQGIRIFLPPDAPRWAYPAIVAAGLTVGAIMISGA